MGWFWLALVAAALLFVGASSVPRGDSALEVGLLLAAMAALLWGVIKGLSVAGDKEPTVPSNPNNPNNPGVDPIPVTGIQFGRFNRQVSGDDIPWCVATRYRITYVVNGVESDPGPSVDVEPSLTETDPLFTLNRPFGVDEVKWYRAVDPNLDLWYEHTSQMEEVLGQMTGVYYIDRANPCDTPFRPDPPTRPEPSGTFDGMWNAIAGQGVVPWCSPTRYRARYVRDNQVSAWSEESVEFYSQIYTQPALRIANPTPGYTIEWIVSSNITLPAGNFPSAPHPNDDPSGELFWFVSPQDEEWYIVMEMYQFWKPGTSELTIPLSVFVSFWNMNSSDNNPGGNRLTIATDGKLVMDPLVASLSDTAELEDTQNPGQWWFTMGFNKFEPTNQPIVASRLPRSNIVNRGERFVDTSNMCREPNRPLDRPEFVRWSSSVTAQSPYAWCKPTKYRYAFVVDGVQSDWSPESEFKSDPFLRDPVFQILKPPWIDGLRWERAVGSSNFDEWTDHTDQMIRDPGFRSEAQFADTTNPCQAPSVPDAPNQPRPNGIFEMMWNQEAGEGVVPWCEPTSYVARYVTDNLASDWSPESVVFQSRQFTVPSLVVDPTPGFNVEWARKTRGTISLTCTMIGNSCAPQDLTMVTIPSGNQSMWQIVFTGLINPTTFPTFTMDLREFVDTWNTWNRNSSVIGSLELLDSGKLALALNPLNGPGRYTVGNGSWWRAMGFPLAFDWQPVLEATSLPFGDVGAVEIIGHGDILNDVDNPCLKPNPPQNNPRWVRFDRNFATRR